MTNTVSETSSENTTPSEAPKKKRTLFFALGFFGVLLCLCIGLGVWYMWPKEKTSTENTTTATQNGTNTIAINAPTNSTTNTTTATPGNTSTPIPTSLTHATMNGVLVYYPKSWGVLTPTTTQEDIVADAPLESSYAGAYIEVSKAPYTFIVLNDAKSYLKDVAAVSNVVKYVQKVYNDQAVQSEEINAVRNPLVPLQNAGIKVYSARYISSIDKAWRGFWYIGNIAQEVGLQPYFVSILYNASLDKVYTVERYLSSSKITAAQKEIDKNATSGEDGTALQEIDDYLRTAYSTDVELKSQVNELLQAVQYIGTK